jgi:hypothetical protein
LVVVGYVVKQPENTMNVQEIIDELRVFSIGGVKRYKFLIDTLEQELSKPTDTDEWLLDRVGQNQISKDRLCCELKEMKQELSKPTENKDTEILDQIQAVEDSVYSNKTYRDCVREIVDKYKTKTHE